MSFHRTNTTPHHHPRLPMETYRAQCHCGRFSFEFLHPSLTATNVEVIDCNCTLCVQRGYLLIYVEHFNLKFLEGNPDELTAYKFAKHQVAHQFCPTCGCGLLGSGPVATAVNVRNVEGIDISALRLKPWNGLAIGRPQLHELPGIAMLRGLGKHAPSGTHR